MKNVLIKKINKILFVFIIINFMIGCSFVKNNTMQHETLLNSYIATNSFIESESKNRDEEIPIDKNKKYEEYLQPKDNFEKISKRDKKDLFCFVGDVFFSKYVRAGYDKKGIKGVLEDSILDKLKNADISIGNLECSITDNIENPADKTWTFALPSSYLKGLKETEIDLFTLANNHILDYGYEALNDTISFLEQININYIGAGNDVYDAKKVYIKEIDGKRYAVLAASAVLPKDSWKATDKKAGVFNGYDISNVAEEVKNIRPYFDKIIVYMHWGNELEEVSNEFQQKCGHRLIDSGADLVVGTHPHVIQEIEYYKGVPIVYSLGNFIYGGQMRDMIMLEAYFDYSKNENGDLKIVITPGISNFQMTRRYWTNEELISKYNEINLKSRNCSIDNDGNVINLEE